MKRKFYTIDFISLVLGIILTKRVYHYHYELFIINAQYQKKCFAETRVTAVTVNESILLGA